MNRPYQAPKLINHGTVKQITAASFNSNAKDFIFGTDLSETPTASGSADACVTLDKEKCKH